MMIKIYHNPRCTKSRQTLALLRERGLEPEIIEYLKTPPTPAELKRIIKSLDASVRDIIRDGEPEYRELGLADRSIADGRLIELICEHPKLLQRPIVISERGARIGRPPEAIEAILP